ncbi:histidinol dehydrogenase, partial [Streptomyces sp. SID7499]|nr:histidinol dehydrogenase [Streptomyces sp. SID7499]
MISRIDLRGDALPEGGALRDLLPRAEFDVEAALETVRPICEDVRHRGSAAVIEWGEK